MNIMVMFYKYNLQNGAYKVRVKHAYIIQDPIRMFSSFCSDIVLHPINFDPKWMHVVWVTEYMSERQLYTIPESR